MKERKRFRGRKTPAPIDGFITSNRHLGAQKTKFAERSGEADLGDADNRLSEGFHPVRSANSSIGIGAEAAEAALLDEPIVLDDLPSERNKKTGRLSKVIGWLKNWSIKKAVLCLAAIVLIFAAYFGVRILIAEHQLLHGGGNSAGITKCQSVSELRKEGDCRINVLILGIGGPGHQGANLTDSMLLASVDPINHKMSLLSIPRDLWVKIPGNGSQKINSAYSDGLMESTASSQTGKEKDGLKLLDKTLEPILGIPINYHVVVDFKAFQQVVDSIGGVDANVPANLTAYENFWIEGTSRHYLLYVPAGEQHFNGEKALYFARERHNDSDFVRSQRQRLLLDAIKQKVFSLGTFSNPIKISNLISSVGNNVYSDFSLSDLTKLYQIGSQIPNSKIASLDLVTAPHDFLTTATYETVTGQLGCQTATDSRCLSIDMPKAGLYKYSDIQYFVRNAMRDGYLAKENASLAIYNATDISGLATSEAYTLKSYGYSVPTVSNTSKVTNPAKTMIVDLTGGKDKYTAHYLEQRFGVTTVTSVPSSVGINPPKGTDFVIILGRDAQNG